ncbi:Glutamate or tyrosine decarboxylase [Arachidicoccus rhizosphaerae]|uniref:Glutamate or tyrosine decarboxylase n=1 Tax=Arachidicoccus rhizosphaerae TaxID=551991 RepID=A0A1H4C6W9_9BACT|nr:pyridoxal-dependent decarboxylase [Arachidicoccus rhizosphaerae]SEA56097.1 Glutamate or tyrosine decarboxylase [Arachidicoccus rhizosphaerae]
MSVAKDPNKDSKITESLLSTNFNNPLSFAPTDWEGLLNQIKEDARQYLEAMREHPVSVGAALPLPAFQRLPENGLGLQQVLADFKKNWSPHLVGSSGPRYVGFVTGGVTPAALAGDWLTTVWDQNTQAVTGQGDVSARLELATIGLLRELLGLPDSLIGGFVTGATMSNFTCLGTARQWWGAQKGLNIALDGLRQDIAVLTATAHSSSIKCLSMLGMGSQNLTKVKVSKGDREIMDMEDLIDKIKQLNGQPFILISSAGTVNTVDFDDFEQIGALKEKYNFWWHIDGAFGAFAACSPEHRHLVKGWEKADSITIDGHKWLNVPYDSGIFFIQKTHHLATYNTFRNSNAPYLGEISGDSLLEKFNYLNFLPENSRRFRALPAWFSLNSYGKRGYQAIVENSIAQAKSLSDWIEQQPELELVAPTRLNNICFTLSANSRDSIHLEDENKSVEKFLYQLNLEGKVFMSPTVYRGRTAIRASFVNWQTSPADILHIQTVIMQTLGRYKS